jgi:hypothetical protein
VDRAGGTKRQRRAKDGPLKMMQIDSHESMD